MKKLILLIAGAVGATLLKRKLDEQQAERALWAEATDTSTGGTSHTTPPSAG
ncbi:MAG: DLW-39 family protein [Intrasporangiaceae bacterium]|nr:DLW-39 family protein [Intrasporangiaceae bacterium]